MAAVTPSAMFGATCYSTNSSADTITFSYASGLMPEVTDAKAHATTGDARAVLYALLERVADWWYAADSADRPAKMSLSRGASLVDTGTETYINRTYTITFRVAITDLNTLTAE